MIHIQGSNVNVLFKNVAKGLLNEGHYNSPRGLRTLELNDAWLEVEDITNPIVSLKSRNLDLDYLDKEMNWYHSGSLMAEDISESASMWDRIKDTNGTVNSNYGFLSLVQKWGGKSQVEWCIDSLLKDPNTRQAVINYNQPIHKYQGVKDFVCTLTQSFIKRDDKLDTVVMMRSNDVIYGLSYDIPWFAKLQRDISSSVGIPVGKYNHYATSLHVYEKHFDMIESIATELC